MINIRHNHIILPVLTALLLISCSQDDLPLPAVTGDDSAILFRTAIPATASRSESPGYGSLDDGFYVTAFCPEDETKIDGSGKMSEYFSEQLVTRTPGMGNAFRSEMCRWPENKGTKEGILKFFAFYPSRRVLREQAGVDGSTDYFTLSNSSTKKGKTVTYNYRMQKFKVNRDIARHVDFVIATAQEKKSDKLYSGVALQFEHQLARVDFQAYGNPKTFDVEIAGVRLGNIFTESGFDFTQKPDISYNSKDSTQNGRWITPQTRGVVEYIYQEGESVIHIAGSGQYDTKAKATSLMGNGGSAMVIPGSYLKRSISATNTGLYFSVLLRVRDIDGMQLYPYIEGADMKDKITTDRMEVIYFAVDKTTGQISKRLYKNEGDYYTDPGFTSTYTLNANEEIRDYGWAAFPPTSSPTALKSGCHHTFIFDYTYGVGVEDRDDAIPGQAIISAITPGVSVKVFSSVDPTDVTDLITIVP